MVEREGNTRVREDRQFMRMVDEDFDVVVSGGGLAGFSAAIAAARHGARTVLIQDRPVLGGNSSSEVRVTPHGAAAFHAYARESGIVSEALITERATNHEPITENGWTNSVWDLVLYDMAVRTDRLTLHLNTVVEGVEKTGEMITAVSARVLGAETQLRITGKVFIDCTGDGTVGALAGASWRSGVEARDEFDEPHAPIDAGEGVMGSSLHFKTVDVGRPVPFTAPDWAVRYDDPEFFYRGGRVPKTLKSGYWWIEIGPPWDTLYENERVRHELTRHLLGIWDFFKNRDPNTMAAAANLALDWVGQVPGKRENRRLMGQLMLTENDLIARTAFPDEVAFGGWYVDLHTIGGLLADTSEPLNARELDPTSDYGAKTNVGPFGIPLGALRSAEVANLLFAGRNVSATHAALGSIRVMSTTAVMGQAVGTVAAMSLGSASLDAFVTSNLGDVQQALLRDGCFLPNVSNADPLDLALRARVSATSEEQFSGVGPQSVNRLGALDHWRDHPVYPFRGELTRRTAQWIALDDRRRLDALELCLENHTDEPIEVTAALHAVDGIWDYRVEPPRIAETTLIVPPRGPHWVRWEIGADVVSPSQYVRVDLDAAEGTEWKVAGTVVPGQVAAYEAAPGLLRRFGGGTTLAFQVEPAQSPYGAGQIRSGVTRPHRATNVWRSDPARPLPQSVELAWDEPVTIAQVQATFAGNLLREYHACPPLYCDPQCVRSYAFHVRVDGGWHEVARVTDNIMSRVVHDLPVPIETDRLRLTVFATHGDPSAAVYELRAYAANVCTPVG
ncbi:FAD-dependent oxidoreductase [Agromyces aerolatus]|uniref:FAD-dependent oxidoreductase n=1 Tax=Agromyces sp. LY-1074 TaxID=3074080 RepID=UPI00285536E5|nr:MULTISPECIES: FAD-dependent oxidoreductase [unclassified Agromyces]MDR5699071.1 FAD-dependent oxidoreductase [Agromyces sp. LY-1074]MDR5705151.1 FAD-dependent oxidoreductase [Agromyces sp. LY-1358]